MEVYPDVITGISATLPLETATSVAVLKTEYDNGIEQRRLLWDSHRRDIKINYSIMHFDKANELRRFYEARRGSFEKFLFFFPQDEVYVKELVGVVLTSISSFELPSLGASSYTLLQNDLPLTEPADWTFTAGTPPNIPDSASIVVAPSLGDIFHFSFNGRLKILARFGNSPMVFREVKKYFATTSVSLTGLEPQLV